MSHRGSDGSDLADRARRQGYAYGVVAENVATGQACVAHVFDSWRKSGGHRRNLIRADVKDMGMWVARGRHGLLFWTLVVGRRKGDQ